MAMIWDEFNLEPEMGESKRAFGVETSQPERYTKRPYWPRMRSIRAYQTRFDSMLALPVSVMVPWVKYNTRMRNL